MRNYILYKAFSADEIFECSYSLLKYLDVYNLKSPASHSLIIYTNDPASLEAYGSFFTNFELRDFYGSAKDEQKKLKLNIIKEFCELNEGNILYLDTNVYPVNELETIFSLLQEGAIFMNQNLGTNNNLSSSLESDLSVLGLNTNAKQIFDTGINGLKNVKSTEGVFANYEDLKEFNILLRKFFHKYQEESIPNQVKLMHHINAKQIQDQKKQFQKLPVYIRWIRKMMGTGWNISSYTKKI